MTARLPISAYRAQKRAENAFASRWAEYEQRKAGWLRTHPEATSTEYQAAMRKIAKECGV